MSALILLLFSPESLAATLSVAKDGSGEFTTISSALVAAVDGDRIEVGAGTWSEALDFGNRSVSLIATEGPELTTIDAQGTSTWALNQVGPEAEIEGFTIHNSGNGGVAIQLGAPTFRDVVFEGLGDAAASYGAAAYVYGGGVNPLFEGCTFSENQAYQGGHVYAGGGAVAAFIDVTFVAGDAYEAGGAIYLNDATVEIDGASFDENHSTNSGAGIYALSGALYITDADFELNESYYGHGSAIHMSLMTDFAISGGTFSTNYSTTYSDGALGGALYIAYSTGSIDGATFDDNTAYYGSALAAYDSSIISSNNTFEDGYAYYGGALYLDYSSFDDVGSAIKQNDSYYYGGGIYAVNYTNLTFDGSSVTENVATYGYGGGIYGYNYITTDAVDSTFSENYSYYNGGGVYMYYSVFESRFEGCTFEDNEAYYGYGGGLYSYYYSSVYLEGSTFSNNYAYYGGGGLYCTYYGAATIRDSLFEYNDAIHYQGGGLYFYSYQNSDYTLTIERTGFEHNTAHYEGGGAFVKDTVSSEIRDSWFSENLSEVSAGGGLYTARLAASTLHGNHFSRNEAIFGGGVYLDEPYGTLSFTNNIVQENQANSGGGLCVMEHDEGDVLNNTFVGNTAQEAGNVCLYQARLDFMNNIVAWSIDGGGLHTYDGNTNGYTDFAYNNFYENGGGDLSGQLTEEWLERGNIYVDPGFANYTLDFVPANDLLQLAPDSELIDAGDPSILDWDGSPSDIGAYGGDALEVEDSDGDGYYTDSDCDDSDPAVYPGAEDEWYDGVNSDCGDGSDYDQDGDGEDAAEYDGDDCDDTDASVIDCPEEETGDTGLSGDTSEPGGDVGGAPGAGEEPEGCGCSAGSGGSVAWIWLGALGLLLRRRS